MEVPTPSDSRSNGPPPSDPPDPPSFAEGTLMARMQEATPEAREHREDMYRLKETRDLLDEADKIASRIRVLQDWGVLTEEQADTLLDELHTTLEVKLDL